MTTPPVPRESEIKKELRAQGWAGQVVDEMSKCIYSFLLTERQRVEERIKEMICPVPSLSDERYEGERVETLIRNNTLSYLLNSLRKQPSTPIE